MDNQTKIALLKDRLNKDSQDIEAAVTLGNLYYDDSNAAQSILYYRHALDLDPALSGVRTDLATMYWRNDNVSLAEQAFREAIRREPGFGHAYLNLGLLLQHAKQDLMAARAIWQDLINNYPEHPVVPNATELLKTIN